MLRLAALLFFLTSGLCVAETRQPDYDGSPLNNTIATAQYLGLLHGPDKNTPIPIIEGGALGQIMPAQFDSVDFYSFAIEQNQWLVELRLDEEPDESMGFDVYDARGRQIYRSQPSLNEETILPLGPGRYFVGISTRPDVARRRALSYQLKIKPNLVLYKDEGKAQCAGAVLLTGRNGMRIDGSLDGLLDRDVYGFVLPWQLMSAYRTGGSYNYRLTLVDPFPGGDGSMVIFGGDGNVHTPPLRRWFDPAIYCFMIDGLSVNTPTNYSVEFVIPESAKRPRNTREDPSDLNDFDLGALASNGQYDKNSDSEGRDKRHIFEDSNLQLDAELSRLYAIREWLFPAESHWFRFRVMQPVDASLILRRLSAPVRATIYDENGAVLATTTSDGISLREDYLPIQRLERRLPAGILFLQIEQLGATTLGSQYAATFMVSAPQE